MKSEIIGRIKEQKDLKDTKVYPAYICNDLWREE